MLTSSLDRKFVAVLHSKRMGHYNDEGWINKKEPRKEEVEVVYKEYKAIRGPCEPDWPSSKALG